MDRRTGKRQKALYVLQADNWFDSCSRANSGLTILLNTAVAIDSRSDHISKSIYFGECKKCDTSVISAWSRSAWSKSNKSAGEEGGG